MNNYYNSLRYYKDLLLVSRTTILNLLPRYLIQEFNEHYGCNTAYDQASALPLSYNSRVLNSIKSF